MNEVETNTEGRESLVEDEHPIISNTKAYILADQYNINDLKVLAKDKFLAAIASNWDHFPFTMALYILFGRHGTCRLVLV